MSATADKARYFLEQSVPELKELERKKLFTPTEIRAIAKKRSDFEHKINARGSSPTDYAQYAEFEINVDQLRKKRVKRLGVKATVHNGQRRIFFVFDRGTRKFPGDLKLWMQSIEYARSQKALKKVTQMLTNALRLHPTKAELWIYAAQFALEANGDMTEARGYMQRGLRFCRNSKDMWLQNFRLELGWIAKIQARRRILGLAQDAAKAEVVKVLGEDDDVMMLPKLTAEDIAPEDEEQDKLDVGALANLESTPIMTGAIPIAVFDAAMKQIPNDCDFAFEFFEDTRGFRDLSASGRLLHHITDTLKDIGRDSWQSYASQILLVGIGVLPNDPDFPGEIREMLIRMTRGLEQTKQRESLAEWCRGYIEGLLHGDLDPAIEMILRSKFQSLS